jgi:hypothetical protein
MTFMKEQTSPMKTNHSTTARILRRHQFLFFLLTLWTLCAVNAYAQSATATLSGTVTDERNAVVVSATVSAVNDATSLTRKATTNSDGYFTLPLLPPGNYTLRIEGQGFAILERRDVILNVGDQRSVLVQLRVGNVAATVNVTDGAALLNESPAVGTVVNRQFVENLPLNGRSFQSLIQLTPGIVATPVANARQGQFSVNGQRESTNYFTVDGVSANIGISLSGNPFGGEGQFGGFNAQGGTNSLVSIDALQEFKILTSTFAPEFGRTPGAQVLLVTRSGTNDFHGTAFEYFRNDALDAADFFVNANRLKKPALRQNQFGGTLSGPVSLSRFGAGGKTFYDGHDKTFFFFSYEGLRLRLPQATVREVPSLAARNSATGAGQTILNAFPLPTGSDLVNGSGQPTGLAQYAASYSDPSQFDAYSIRLDHAVNQRVSLFGRYNYSPSENQSRGLSPRSLSQIQLTSNRIQTFTAGATFVFTPQITNDFRFNVSQNKGNNRSMADTFGGASLPDESLIYPSITSSSQSQAVIYLTGAFTPTLNLGKRTGNAQKLFNFIDTFSLVAGSHQIKFGADYRRVLPSFDFATVALNIFYNSVADVAATRVNRSIVSAFINPIFPEYQNLSFFGQDTWRVSSRLTLTYGLRYEINPPPGEKNNNLPQTALGIGNPLTATLAAPGTPLFETKYNNFAPRVGAAYQLNQSPKFGTVVRGGFGVFYDLATGQASTAFDPFYFPFSRTRTYTGANAQLPINPALVTSLTPQSAPYQSVLAFGPDLKLPYTLQFNASVEQLIGANQTVSATYVGALGRRLYRTESFINPNASFLDLDIVSNSATSSYHALQLQYQHRLSRGLQALASYTLSHSIDTSSGEVSAGNLPGYISSVEQNRGSSDFDRRHSFNWAATYDLPKPNFGKVGNAVFGGFSFDAIYKTLSAAPVNIFRNVSRDNSISSIIVRPDLVAGQPLYIEDATLPGGRRFNPAAFVSVPNAPGSPFPARQGSLGRNVLRGFPASQLDVALRRRFNFTENFNALFKIEAFNVLNHPNFADPTGNISSGLFGRATQSLNRGLGGLNALYQLGGPRSIQLSLRLQF